MNNKINLIFAKFLKVLILQSPPKFRRLLLVLIDVLAIIFSYILIDWIYKNNLILNNQSYSYSIILFSIIIGIPLFFFTGQYKGLTRYVGSLALYKIAYRNFFLVSILISRNYLFDQKIIPISFWFLLWFILSSFTGLTRFILRDILINFPIKVTKKIPKVAIFGAGESGALLASSLNISKSHNLEFFIDDAPNLWGRNINGIKIYSREYLKKGYRRIDKLILSIPSL